MTIALQTDRLEISPLTRVDVPSFVAYRQHADVARYQGWEVSFSNTDAEALIAGQPASGMPDAGQWVQLALRARWPVSPLDALVGDVGVGAVLGQPDTYELGVTIAPEHQGFGYASEALRGVIDWLMREHSAHRIEMQGDARNVRVLTLLRRIGLRHEGTVLDGDWFKGQWTTLERFAVLRREWLER